MFNFDFSVHEVGSIDLHLMTDRQQHWFDRKNVKIKNTVETKTHTSWMPLR